MLTTNMLPAKYEHSSFFANRPRNEASSGCTVRRITAHVSRTNQWPWQRIIVRSMACFRPGVGAFFDELSEMRRRRNPIDQFPRLGAVGAHPFGGGAKDVGEITPHLALVDQPGEAAVAGQYTEKRHFGQTDRA